MCLIGEREKNPLKLKNIKGDKNMKFEEVYKKFLEGTATDEEIEFVRSEMKKASEINDILNNKQENLIDKAEQETVKKAMKSYWKKDTLKILVIVCTIVVVLSLAISLAIGIPVLSNAKNNTNYTVEQAEVIAIEYLSERYPNSKDKIEVYKVEKELEVEGRLKNARYIYVLDVYNGVNNVFEIEIDSKTGKIIEVDS